jgi:hypothetical protein
MRPKGGGRASVLPAAARLNRRRRQWRRDLASARAIGLDRDSYMRIRSPEIGFSPIRLHAPFLRNGNASPQSRDFLTTTWVGTSIRMVFV